MFVYRLAENIKNKECSDFTFKPEGRTAKVDMTWLSFMSWGESS